MALLRLGTDGRLMLNGQTVVPEKKLIKKTIVILADTSGSVAGPKLDQIKSGAADFSAPLSAQGYDVQIIAFNTDARLVHDLRTLKAGGTTFIGKALRVAEKIPNLSHVLVVTDGIANDPEEALSIAFSMKAKGVEILTLGTHDADANFLSCLASRPGLSVQTNDQGIKSAMSNAALLLTSGSQIER